MLRLTGGQFRGRSIQTPKSLTRPTQAKLRQALLNSLQTRIPQASVLDLFAGSGALGFEALSRGAAHVTFVESCRSAIKLIAENAKELGVSGQVRIVCDALSLEFPKLPAEVRARLGSEGAYDIVLADPPYAGGWELALLLRLPWGELLREDGIFCLEWGKQKSQVAELPDSVPFLAKAREKNYGDSVLSSYARSAGESREPKT